MQVEQGGRGTRAPATRRVSRGGEGQVDRAGFSSSFSAETFPHTPTVYSGSLGMTLVCVNLNALGWKIPENKM